jgi:hypothetical protein
MNDLFEGGPTDRDKLVYVVMRNLLESERLQQQAVSNTKEQFSNSLSSV